MIDFKSVLVDEFDESWHWAFNRVVVDLFMSERSRIERLPDVFDLANRVHTSAIKLMEEQESRTKFGLPEIPANGLARDGEAAIHEAVVAWISIFRPGFLPSLTTREFADSVADSFGKRQDAGELAYQLMTKY